MADIIRIVIKSSSGYCDVYDMFKDKVIITSKSISYEYKPMFELKGAEENCKKWNYKTNSIEFKEKFKYIAELLLEVIEKEVDKYYLDIGEIEFNIIYSDKSKIRKSYWLPNDYFEELFMEIRKLIPECENIPIGLKLVKDYEEE